MMWSRNSFSLARNLLSCAIISGVGPGDGASGACAGAGAVLSRRFLLTICGAMIAFSTLAEPQTGQVTSLRFTWESKAEELWNQLSNVWSRSQRSAYRIMLILGPDADVRGPIWGRPRKSAVRAPAMAPTCARLRPWRGRSWP